MHISWLGQTCVKLQTKHSDKDIVTIIDAYKPATGEFPRSLTPDIGIFSKSLEGAITLSQDPFILDTLGECDIKDVMMRTFPGTNDSLVLSISVEGIHVVHLGRITSFTEDLIEKIGGVDVLLLPVGGNKQYLKPEDAAALVTAIEPRIVIPIAYQCDSDKSAEPLSVFLKEAGLKPKVTDKKLILKKKDLPADETQLIVLEKNV